MTDVGARVADMLIALIGGADPRDLSDILPVHCRSSAPRSDRLPISRT